MVVECVVGICRLVGNGTYRCGVDSIGTVPSVRSWQ